YPELVEHCAKLKLLFLSTPFDEDSADFLADLSMQAFKVPSGEVTNLPLLEHIAHKGKPMIVSTGMCTLDEVKQAVDTISRVTDSGLVLLQCVSNYPAAASDVNLRAMTTLANTFHVPVGYCDRV